MGLLLGQKCLFKVETRGHISTPFYWGPPHPPATWVASSLYKEILLWS